MKPKHLEAIESERSRSRLQNDLVQTKAQNKILHTRIVELEKLVKVASVKTIEDYEIPILKGDKMSSATAVVVYSDWHLEETVTKAQVNGLNHYNLEEARKRILSCFQNTARLVHGKKKHITIKTCVLALLGDFITGNIHEELMEGNSLSPTQAILEAVGHLSSGIQFLLKHTDCNLVIPCHSGNHARFTHKQRHATEAGNSLEYLAYHMLAKDFQGNQRVKFIIPEGHFSYLDVNGFIIRFHHGFNIKYQGGIGGLYIPLNKAIGQWNKAKRADLDVLGHWHSFRFAGNAVVNGSLIGYGAYALAIKADFEKPKQAFFLINHQRKEVTDFCPIWVD